MASLAVITPSYAPDFELFRDLHRSVLDNTPESVVHHVLVPASDATLFARLAGPRCVVWSEKDLLPRRVVAVPMVNAWVNLRRPVPPLRGWVMQQLLKLEASARIDADVLLLVDSDVVVVRPVTADTFLRNGAVRFYHKDGEVDGRLPRHVRWHEVARRLLGLPGDSPPLPDYVSAFNVWHGAVVRAMLKRIETMTHRPWLDAVGAELHLSEFILYGVFVDGCKPAGPALESTERTLCHSYWDAIPLDQQTADEFVRRLAPNDVAVMISAKSRTPLAVRRAALSSVLSGGHSLS